MSVQFKDFSIEVKDVIEEAAIAWLEEAAGELEAQVKRNTPVDTGDLKNAWTHIIDESELKGIIGNPLENAIWTEFGTGEYALHGDGRKGGWYIPESKLSETAKSKMANSRTVIKGEVFYYTKGRRPERSLHKAYTKLEPKLIKSAKKIFKEKLNDNGSA